MASFTSTRTKRRRKAGHDGTGSSEERRDCQEGGEEGDDDVTAYEQLLTTLGTRRRGRRCVHGDSTTGGPLTANDSELPSKDGYVTKLSDTVSEVLSKQGGNGDGGDGSDNGGDSGDSGDGGNIGDGGDSGDGGHSGDGGDSEVESDSCTLKDPFKEHFDPVLSYEEVAALESVMSSPSLPSHSSPLPSLGIVTHRPGLSGREPHISSHSCSFSQLQVKRKLCSNWKGSQTASPFSDLQRHLFHHMNSYKDMLYSQQTFENAEDIRRVYVLHALNHVLKTRSRVLKNNHKLLQASKEGRSMEEPRDQGLARPKVLILLPFRHSALQVIDTLTSLLVPPGQGLVHNQRRFRREFATEGVVPGTVKVPKPSSYSAMFSGNTDDCFKVGVALRGKGLRLYADFYSADIIVASPLGLRTVIGAEGENKRDYDFLSSVELVVLDRTDVFLMQNWEHVTHVLSHLHLKPREAHGVDFSRVRLWALNEWSHFYRQTLIFSALQTPEINSLLTTYCHNYAGSVRWDSDAGGEEGSVVQVVRQLPQMFTRLSSPSSFAELAESRLQHFTAHVLPGYQGDLMKGTLIFIPSYFDFVRVRNYMKKQELSFAVISEYTSPSKVSRARTQFYQRITHFLLYTERAHFFHRYRLKGVQHVLLYSLPTYPEHYSDVVNMVEGEEGTVEVPYSHWDQLALCRVVGGSRAKRMISSSDNTHMLVTGGQPLQ